MSSLGLRCSNTDYTYAVLDGPGASPNLIQWDTVAIPASFGRAEAMHWLVQEFSALIDKYKPSTIVIRKSEATKASKALERRIENEAAAYVAAGSHGLKSVSKKVRATIAKDLGLKGKAKYLETKLDTSVIPDYENLPNKAQDAVLAAWSKRP